MKLPAEWEAIVEKSCSKFDGAIAIDAATKAVERCYALHSKPRKELTDAEIEAIHLRHFPRDSCPVTQSVIDSHRSVIAAHERKQREPETVTFRAARHKASERIEMLVPERGNLNCDWEWLEPPQTFEVKLP